MYAADSLSIFKMAIFSGNSVSAGCGRLRRRKPVSQGETQGTGGISCKRYFEMFSQATSEPSKWDLVGSCDVIFSFRMIFLLL